ncbi:hypothetical protein TRVA0_017S02630 [Trichomonascus vanleenenianus]|uniref:uncharacterized protein n=1 Tax=Trichomonascus vanleenenianus TaxID=2268995 RepID=UPI003ECB526B
MADQRNVFYFDKGGLRPEIVLASEDDSEIPPVIRNLCMHPRSATAIPLKESETLTVQAYFAQAEELLMAISVLIYTLLPEPPSVTQILNALYANIETRKRTIVIKSNRVVFMFSNREITLPWIMSSILVRYLTVVRALQVYLAEQLGYGEGSLQRMRSLLVANYAMGTSESLFSAQTKELTQLYIGIAVDEKAWAAVISQFYEGKKSSDSYAAGFKEWYDMIGLSSASLDTWPQLGMKSILPL